MTETEVADLVMTILGMDRSDIGRVITEVEAGDSMDELEIEVEGGQRFTLTLTVSEKKS